MDQLGQTAAVRVAVAQVRLEMGQAVPLEETEVLEVLQQYLVRQ